MTNGVKHSVFGMPEPWRMLFQELGLKSENQRGAGNVVIDRLETPTLD